jgi:hypothetical protein
MYGFLGDRTVPVSRRWDFLANPLRVVLLVDGGSRALMLLLQVNISSMLVMRYKLGRLAVVVGKLIC